MKLRMEVTRFRNEDVIATSGVGPVVPPSDVCAQTGMTHILATLVSYNAAANTTTVTGPSFIYVEKGKMQSTGNGLTTVEVSGEVTPRTFIYYDGSRYIVCDPQAHAR